jgi:uncharacterized protein YbjQ (UPF0145 family)
MVINTTKSVEKYELQICSVIKDIQAIQSSLQRRDGIAHFSRLHPEKIDESVAELTKAQQILHNAMRLLLKSGNAKKAEI